MEVFYIFSDTYGLGFELSWMKGGSVGFRFGVWNEEGDETSYNYKEFWNLLKTLEELGKEVNLQEKEVLSAHIIWYWRAYLQQVPHHWKCYSIW